MNTANVTRYIDLGEGANRAYAKNPATILGRSGNVSSYPPHLEKEFHGRSLQFREPGYLLVAVSATRGVCGELWLRASRKLRAASVGRHSRAELFLPWDAGFALRQLVVFTWLAGGRPWVQLRDLHSAEGLQGLSSAGVSAIESSGALSVNCGNYRFLLFPTGVGDGSQLAPVAPVLLPRESARLPLLAGGESPVGILEIFGPRFEGLVRIGAAALNRGVLLGRYFRCDTPTALFDQSVSRVHAMLLRHHGRVYLVDTGSTYGIWVGRRPVKCAVLVQRENYTLSATTVLRWNRLQRPNETRSA